MEEQEESNDTEPTVLHIESDKCQCPEYDKNRKRFILIIDVYRYVNALNDWD